MDAVGEDDNDRNCKDADGIYEAERIGVKRRLRDLQEFCRVKLRKVPSTLAKAVELREKHVKQFVDSGLQIANDVVAMTLPAIETEVVRLSAILNTSRKEAVSVKA